MSRFYSQNEAEIVPEITETDIKTPRLSEKFERICGKRELTNEVITTRSPQGLQHWFGAQRVRINRFLNKGEKKIEEATNSHQTYEKQFLKNYVDPIIEPSKKENLAVGSGVITIGFLSGLIVNKNIKQLRYIKPVMPLTLALIGFKLALPETFKSFVDVSYKVEGNFVSEGFLRKQDLLVKKTKDTERKIQDTVVGVEKCIAKETTKIQNGFNRVLSFFS